MRVEREWVASETDQTAAESDQTSSDSDQTSADSDEARAESDQLSSDRDQATADRERDALAPTARPEAAYELSRAERQAGGRARRVASAEREATAAERLEQASKRDAGAHARDLSAEARDRNAAERDQISEALDRGHDVPLSSALEARERAAAARARAAGDRARAAGDRKQAASDRANAAAERAYARSQLRSAEAHTEETLGALVSGVTHNFNNLLAIVLLSAEQLASRADVPGRADLQKIIIAADRGAEITAQLLVFAGLGSEALSPVTPSSAIRELEPTLSRLMDDGVAIDFALDPEDLQVFVGAEDFNHLVVNLVLNARDAMPGGGTVKIATASRSFTKEQAGEFGRDPGGYVDVSVSDTGSGISAELQERMFDPFFTTKGGESSGLGLATVRRVVDRAGGWIEVRSSLEEGTTFSVALPEFAAAS